MRTLSDKVIPIKNTPKLDIRLPQATRLNIYDLNSSNLLQELANDLINSWEMKDITRQMIDCDNGEVVVQPLRPS